MTKAKIMIPGDQTPKARPRVVNSGQKRYAFTPRSTKDREDDIRIACLAQAPDIFFSRDVPLKVRLSFYHRRPKSWPKRKQAWTTRPDWDNLGKLVTDAMEGLLFADDAQITTVVVRKRLTLNEPYTLIEIEEDQGERK